MFQFVLDMTSFGHGWSILFFFVDFFGNDFHTVGIGSLKLSFSFALQN